MSGANNRRLPIMRIPEWAIRTDELLPCPFCGGEAFMVMYRDKQKEGREIKCTCCAATKRGRPLHSSMEWLEGKMIEGWNQRTPLPLPASNIGENDGE